MNHRLSAIALLLTACSSFDPLERGVCGNGLIEPGEDCDSDDESCVRCAVSCDSVADCPNADYACGNDGLCHAPGGALGTPSGAVTFQADDLVVTDVDHDGAGDVVGVSNTSLVVRHGDPAGALAGVDSIVTPAQSGPAAFGDLDGDGAIDVTLSTADGLVSFTSRFGTLSPVDVEQPILGDNGDALDLVSMFGIGPLQLGAFFESSGQIGLVVVDFLRGANGSVATLPCSARLGTIGAAQFVPDSIDVYEASAKDAVVKDFVVSFTTTSGAVCVTAIHGSTLAGYTLTEATPTGIGSLAARPVLADLDTDLDPCPDLISSEGGAGALRRWPGRLVNGSCALDPAGAAGALLPALPNAPPTAVAVGHIPVPGVPLPGIASDALVVSNGIYVFAPGSNSFGQIYTSERALAHVASDDLDSDGDIDAVLAAADEDDLDVLYRFPLGFELLRIDTAGQVTTITLGDFDGNNHVDIAYTERAADHQDMQIAYGTPDRPLPPVRVGTFSGVATVTPVEFGDSIDTLAICEDLFVIQPAVSGGLPTMSLLHGSPQRTMLSFFDPRDGNLPTTTILRAAVIGDFVDSTEHHPDLIGIAAPRTDQTIGMLAFRVAGTEAGLDPTPSLGVPANGVADCPTGSGLCVQEAVYLPWPQAAQHDVVIAVDRAAVPHAEMLDAWAPGGLAATPIPVLVENLPAGAVVRSLHSADIDGDGTLDLIASFAATGGAGSVRSCQLANGIPVSCQELAPAVTAIAPDIVGCSDAAPGRLSPRDATTTPAPARDLVVLCHDAANATSLFRISHDSGAFRATFLAQATALAAIRTGDVTGDGVDDVIAVAGDSGARSLVVFPQCTSRDLACLAATTDREAP